MKYIISIITVIFFGKPLLYAQGNNAINKVIVETYYISNSLDATDSTGLPLQIGSTTFRIFIDMKPGAKLKKIYGDAFHPIKIMSTDTFWNNTDNGETFAYNINKNRLGDNTVALDSWLTLGQATKLTPIPYFGILKISDRDGSIVGGVNNDGGSASIAQGLLTNSNAQIGVALTIADGLDTMTITPSNWANYGFIDEISNEDSTVFGSLKRGKSFISYNAGLQNSGVQGVLADSNQVLVAQLTTKGTLTFELNLEIEETNNGITSIVKYVANADTLFEGEVLCPFLKYPLLCGCLDANFAEYNAEYGCNNHDSCKTPLVYGCMDTAACNYDPKANFNIKNLCCYPGYCNDRELSVVCPELAIGNFQFYIYPNPNDGLLSLKFNSVEQSTASYSIFKSDGTSVVAETNLGSIQGNFLYTINTENLLSGLFLFKLTIAGKSFQKTFSRN